MRPNARWVFPFLVLAVLVTGQSPAEAQPLADAKHHFDQGVALYNEGNYNAALAEFEASYKAYPVGAVLYNIGLTQKALFRYTEAMRSLERYLAEAQPPPKRERRNEVEQIIREMNALLADVKLDIAPPGAQVIIDGRPAGSAPLSGVRLPAGQHVVEVKAEGYEPARKEVMVAASVPLSLSFALKAIPKSARVQITASEPRALVKIDGKTAGLAPLDIDLPAGGHRLVVSAPGCAVHQSELLVTAGEPRTVNVVLEVRRDRIYQKWWFWTIIGTAVAGGAAAAIAVPLSNRVQDPIVGTLQPGIGKVN